jgi:PAS domain-containing protein
MPEALCDLQDNTFLTTFRDSQTREIEFTYPSTKGPRHFQIRVIPEKAPDGCVKTVVGVTRDITERKHLMGR